MELKQAISQKEKERSLNDDLKKKGEESKATLDKFRGKEKEERDKIERV